MSLELIAMWWLRHKKRCPVVICERTPRWHVGRPDVLGITQARYLFEVEIKRSAADFRADANKRHRQPDYLEFYKARIPKRIWYLAEYEIAEAIKSEVKPPFGLLAGQEGLVWPRELITPETNHNSNRLSFNECVHLAHLMANQILALKEENERLWRDRIREPSIQNSPQFTERLNEKQENQ